MHARVLKGENDHHKAEAMCKALGRALSAATRIEPRRGDAIPSTKGTLGCRLPNSAAAASSNGFRRSRPKMTCEPEISAKSAPGSH